MSDMADAIEREVQINAPIARVWALVSEPGWWINDGEIREHELRADPERPGVTIVTDPQHGAFSIETVTRREPSLIVYRWLGGQADAADSVVNTLVTFTLEETDGATTLTVVESGWSSAEPTARVRSEFEANGQGWDQEMAAAKRHAEGA